MTPHTLALELDNDRKWLRQALTLWGIFFVAVSVKSIIEPIRHSVLAAYTHGSQAWWADQTYTIGANYLYPPTFSVAFTPLAMLPPAVSNILWDGLSLGLLAWAIVRLTRDVLPGVWSDKRLGILLMLSLVGTIRGVWAEQVNTLVFALCALGVSAIMRRRWWTAATLLAIPVFIKVWPIALAMLLITCWPRQLFGRFAVAFAGLAAIPFLTRPASIVIAQYQSYAAMLIERNNGRAHAGLRDAWTIWEGFGGVGDPKIFTLVSLVAAAGIFAWTLTLRLRGTSPCRLATAVLSMWVGWQLLFGPRTEPQTKRLIAPPASWAVMESFSTKRFRVLSVAAWLLTALLGTGAVERALLPFFSGSPAILPSGVVVFLGWLLAYTCLPLRKAETVSLESVEERPLSQAA
jgi:hypothetical protein